MIGNGAFTWLESYLSHRKQKFCIDGTLSEEQDVKIEVPQGSTLGPLLYVIYTSDLPESIHSHEKLSPTGYDWDCSECGSLCCYADDSTLTISGPDSHTVSHQITEKYKAVDTFMLNNRLVLNSDKTHLLVLSSPHRHRKYDNFNVIINIK